MHFLAYSLKPTKEGHRLDMAKRLSTDTAGIATRLGLQGEPKMELEVILRLIEQKITAQTIFSINQPLPPISVDLVG
jgi:hypothetical protein